MSFHGPVRHGYGLIGVDKTGKSVRKEHPFTPVGATRTHCTSSPGVKQDATSHPCSHHLLHFANQMNFMSVLSEAAAVISPAL